MYVMGTADSIVDYNGSYGQDSAQQDFSYWGGMLGCNMNSATKTSLPVKVHDGTSVTEQQVSACSAGGAVQLYTIKNGGHAWPGYPYPNAGLGIVSQNFDATLAIGQFASQWTTNSTH
jgi:polyhydroxybutyrate depolymerase